MAIYKEVEELLKAMDTWDKYGVSFGLFRLNKNNEKDFVPYVKYEDMIQAVTGTPHADVKPVVHAHWVEDDDGVHCSKCKKDAPLEVFTYSFHPTTDSWDGDVKFNKSEFCPSCGAKMDKEVE